MTTRSMLVLATIVLAVGLSACSQPAIQISYLRPPKRDIPEHIKKVGLVFTTSQNANLSEAGIEERVSAKIESALIENGHYRVVTRNELSVLLKERNLSFSDFAAGEQSDLQLQGVDALIVGSITNAEAIEGRGLITTRVLEMVRRPPPLPPTRRYIIKRTKGRYVTVNVAITFRMLDAKKGYVYASKPVQRDYDSRNAMRAGSQTYAVPEGQLPSKGKKLEELIEDASREFMMEIVPYTVTKTVRLIQNGPYSEQGVKFATRGLIEEALEQFEYAVQSENPNDGALYDKGVMLEVLGRYQEAYEAYKAAYGLSGNDLYLNGMTRMKSELKIAAENE